MAQSRRANPRNRTLKTWRNQAPAEGAPTQAKPDPLFPTGLAGSPRHTQHKIFRIDFYHCISWVGPKFLFPILHFLYVKAGTGAASFSCFVGLPSEPPAHPHPRISPYKFARCHWPSRASFSISQRSIKPTPALAPRTFFFFFFSNPNNVVCL